LTSLENADDSNLILPRTEFERRIRSVKEKMESRNLNSVILTRPESIFYCCGYRAAWIASWASELHGLIIPNKGDPRLIVRALERKTAQSQATKDPVVYADQVGPWKVLIEILDPALAIGKDIGVEKRFLSAYQYEKIQNSYPASNFKDATSLINGLMARPSPLEVECTRKAAEITNKGFSRAVDVSRRGIHLYEIMAEIENAMYKAGQTEQNRSLCLVWTGPGGGAMHDTDLTRKIERDDLVTIEIWGTWKHYRAGAQCTLHAGITPPRDLVETYDVVSKMYRSTRDCIAPGVTTGEVFDAANGPYRAKYGSDYYRRVGGLMGLASMIVNLTKGGNEKIVEGQVYLVQPQTNDPLLITVCGSVLTTSSGTEELCKPFLEIVTI
jgi:Xaa-Pro dipeptidase